LDGTGLVVHNSGSIIGTGNQRNGTVYADSTAQDFTLYNADGGTIDAGAGNEGAGFSVELSEAGNAFDIVNAGTIQGRGQGAAGAGTAGDGLRFERTRVSGMLDGSTTGLFTGSITNRGTIDSEAAAGTTAGIRFVNGTSFQGTLTNEAGGVISGVNNGLYFGNATPAGGGDHTGGVVMNAGTISSDGTGLVVHNSGSIIGTGNQRNGTVYADGTADNYTLYNAASGNIDAGAGNQGSAISLQSGVTDGDTRTVSIINAGTINGRGAALGSGETAGIRIFNGAGAGTTVTVNGDITNTGSIGSETSSAILIENVNYTGTITNSGTLSGTSVLDASSALGAITFNQIGGAFNADFIGSSFADTLSISGPSFTLAGDILGGVATSIDAATTASVSGARSLIGDLTSNGTLNFNLGTDSLAVTGNTIFGSNSVVNVIASGDVSNLTLGQAINVITQTGNFTNNGVTVNITEDDFLVDYAVNLNTLIITPTATDLSAVSSDANIAALGTGITAAFAAGGLQQNAVTALNGIQNAAGFEAVSLSLLPALNEAVSREVWESHSQSSDLILRRFHTDAQSGAWVDGQLRSSDRDGETLSVRGYDADTTAFAAGYDRQVSDNLRLGVAYNYADTDIEEVGDAGENTDLSTSQISAYAGYAANGGYANAQLGYIFGDGETERVSELGPVTGDFDVSGFAAQAIVGYDYGVLSPLAGVRLGNISQGSYTENGGLGLTVDADSVSYFEGLIGATLTPKIETGSAWAVKPVIRANYVYDLNNGPRDVRVTLPSAQAQTLSSGGIAGSRFELGGSFNLIAQSGLSLGVGYEGDFASGYNSHAVFARMHVGF